VSAIGCGWPRCVMWPGASGFALACMLCRVCATCFCASRIPCKCLLLCSAARAVHTDSGLGPPHTALCNRRLKAHLLHFASTLRLPPGSLRCLRCRPLVAPPSRPAQNSRRSRGEKAGARSERPWCDAAASRPCVQAWAPRHAGSPRSGAAAQPLRQRHDCAPAPACWEGALTCEDLDSADAPL